MDFAGLHRMRPIFAAALALGCLAVACSDKTTSVTTPSPSITVSGTWTGNVTVADTATRMTWTLAQSTNAVTGPVLLSLPSGTVLMNGFLTGTLNGSVLTYTISVGPGGIPTQPTCAG